ncbi:Hint domain-containing protein [Methylobacterium indicum]|uniref:Hint domain-containing protein n=1 Tax=Methylobacterium indicum TaxID=1775910 RepID=UPI0009E2775D|nr:Hint domain-containing protein [Methylobacterium indicum]
MANASASTREQEVSFLSGVSANGTLAGQAFEAWKGDTPDTYSTTSTQFHWGAASSAGTSGGTLNYYFAPSSNWSASEQASLSSGLDMWSAVANISFQQTTSADAANITFERNTNGKAVMTGEGAPTPVGSSTIATPVGNNVKISMDIRNVAEGPTATGGHGSLGDYQNGGYGVHTTLHEEGHALGLGHGGPYNNTNTPAQQLGPYDNQISSIMSYFGPSDKTSYASPFGPTDWTTGGVASVPTTWMPVDIDAVQRLYGIQTNGPLNAAQTFGYNTTITGSLKPYFDFATNTKPVITVYGTAAKGNALDLSQSGQSATLNLNSGTYSSALGLKNNIAIYDKTYIENVVCGSGDDICTVNVGKDNTIDGGGGTNTAVLLGNRADYSIVQANGSTVVTRIASSDLSARPVGVQDKLSNFQTLRFDDQAVTLCYASGTRIRASFDGTPREVEIETLRVGDLVVTASGEVRPIRWIGRRSLNCFRHPRPEAIWPVRILANAFGLGLPSRDLWLSPDHSVRVSVLDDVLIPVKHLLNDATVAQVPVEVVTYLHVELDSHDILLAEGLPAESFLDTGVRAGFENAAEHMTLHPDFAPLTLDDFCLPLVQDGPIVDAVRTRLIARAQALGWTLTNEDDLHVVADGVAIRPERNGTTARFVLPAGVQDVRLVSRHFVPERVRVGAGDGRRLGVPVQGISVIDGHGVIRALPMDSAALKTGFSFVQDGSWRWTTGDAVVPSALWAGCEDTVTLVVETAPDRGTLSAWLAPATSVDSAALAA